MLAVHWSPVKNTKRILRNGIRKGKQGLFCFPLTGHDMVDRWWAQAFRSWDPRTQYNGFIFRITRDDLPAKFSSWVADAMGFAQTIDSLDELDAEFRKTIIWGIGQSYSTNLGYDDFAEIGEKMIRQDPRLYSRFQSDPNWMRWVFHDYQIVLSHSIDHKRIIRTVSAAQQSGRQRVLKHRNATPHDLA